MSKGSMIRTVFSLLASFACLPAIAAQVANYDFQNTLSSSHAPAASLVDLGSGSFTTDDVLGQPCTVFEFAEQAGLSLDISGLLPGAGYSFVAVMRLAETYAYAKILDVHDRLLDEGLYAYENRLVYYNYTGLGLSQLSDDTWAQVALTFDGTMLRGYVNGALAFEESDTEAVGAITADTLYFFRDDVDTLEGENSAGQVANIQLFDEALSNQAIAAISFDCGNNGGVTPPPPTPPQLPAQAIPAHSTIGSVLLVMLMSTFGGVLLWRNRS